MSGHAEQGRTVEMDALMWKCGGHQYDRFTSLAFLKQTVSIPPAPAVECSPLQICFLASSLPMRSRIAAVFSSCALVLSRQAFSPSFCLLADRQRNITAREKGSAIIALPTMTEESKCLSFCPDARK